MKKIKIIVSCIFTFSILAIRNIAYADVVMPPSIKYDLTYYLALMLVVGIVLAVFVAALYFVNKKYIIQEKKEKNDEIK